MANEDRKMRYTSNAPEGMSALPNFLSLTKQGFHKVSRAAVRFNLPQMMFGKSQSFLGPELTTVTQELTFMCEASELPGKGFMTTDVANPHPNMKMPHGIQFNDLNISLICRADLQEKKFFDYWMNEILPSNGYNFKFLDEYSTVIDIFAFDEVGRGVYQQSLEKAYPINVMPIQTMWADDQITRLTVTFTYRRWRNKIEPTNVALSSLVRGAEITRDSVLGTALIS